MGAKYDPILGALRQKDSGGGSTGAEIWLAACSALGYANTASGPSFSWVDPENVILNGSTLATWDKTVLVRKENEYPATAADGVVIATTSAELANKNYYRDHQCVDSTQEEGKTYCYKLFSQTSAGVWNDLDGNKFTSGVGLSWGQITQYIRSGRGAELLPVGSVLYADHPEYTHQDSTGIAFMVVGHDQVPAQDETLVHTMCLKMAEVLFNAPYDNNESTYVLTGDTTAQAGKSYYSLSGSTYTKLVDGTDYNVGDAIPMASWYEKNIDGRNNGSNNPVQSNLIQWANSSGAAGSWYEKKTLWDTCSSTLLNKSGFCRFLDPEFLAAVKPAKLTTAKCNAEGAGDVTHNAKFWPLSMTQVYGSTNNSVTENIRLKYFADGGSAVCKIMDTNTATNWWLRSPDAGVTGRVYSVQASGASGGNFACGTGGVSLACIIA